MHLPPRPRIGPLLAAMAMLGTVLAAPALATDPPVPGGPFVPPNQQTVNRAAMLTYDEIVDQLQQLERRSRGELELVDIGTSGEGRTLWGARIGDGDTRVWLQGRIHGNEPYGAEALLALLRSLVAGGGPAGELLDELTLLVIPIYNPDGSEAYIRQDVVNGIDLNRDWGVSEEDLAIVNQLRAEAGLPPRSLDDYTRFTAVESRQYWYAWADFQPSFAIDLHHQGTYYEAGTDEMTAFSLGIPLLPEMLDEQIWDQARQLAVVSYDAADRLGYANVTRYPDINIPEAVVSSMALGGPGPDGEDPGFESAAFFLESRAGIGTKSRGYLVRQNVVVVEAMLAAIADGSLAEVDADRWAELPRRGAPIRTSDRFPNSGF